MEVLMFVCAVLIALMVGGVAGWWARGPGVESVVERVVAPSNRPRSAVAFPISLPANAERPDSPFVTCEFTDGAALVARKRLRKESATDPILWAGKEYTLTGTAPGLRSYKARS